jgi:hypothetical protein
MRHVRALARGDLVGTGPWTGRVLSAHPRALNILRADGLVVSVVADSSSMSAMGVLVPRLPAEQPGPQAAVVMEGATLRIFPLVALDCAKAAAWEGKADRAAVLGMSFSLVAALQANLMSLGNPGGLLGVLGGEGTVFSDRARSALESGRPEELVGLGPGLTPAGDDFLMGVMLAYPGFDCSRLEGALQGTTPAGRTLLSMAMQGRFPAYLLQFVGTVASGSVDVEEAVRTACAHGETSGTDALAGFCWQKLYSGPASGQPRPLTAERPTVRASEKG